MIPVSRDWATPLTIGVFLLMAATGLLMFFHLDTGLQKILHEWLGWGLVAVVAAHALANWRGFVRYFKPSVSRRAPAVIGLCALLLAATFVVRPAQEADEAPPPVIALRAMGQAPLAQVAPLFGHDAASAQRVLADAGLTVTDGQQTLQQITAGDREQFGAALRALASKR